MLQTEQLTPAWINPQVLRACNLRACEQECPVFITYIDKIVDLRATWSWSAASSRAVAGPFKGWRRSATLQLLARATRNGPRANIPLRAEARRGMAVLGRLRSFDDRSRVARAATNYWEAGVDFAILGPEEQCNGDPALRGTIPLQMLAQASIETLNRYNVKKIVTTCPHCYHTLKNEYPDFGGHYEVTHHAELLAQLIQQGKLRPRFPLKATIAYHDACYLGRHNQIYDAPREIINQIPGAYVAEAPESRDRGMLRSGRGADVEGREHGDARPHARQAAA